MVVLVLVVGRWLGGRGRGGGYVLIVSNMSSTPGFDKDNKDVKALIKHSVPVLFRTKGVMSKLTQCQSEYQKATDLFVQKSKHYMKEVDEESSPLMRRGSKAERQAQVTITEGKWLQVLRDTSKTDAEKASMLQTILDQALDTQLVSHTEVHPLLYEEVMQKLMS